MKKIFVENIPVSIPDGYQRVTRGETHIGDLLWTPEDNQWTAAEEGEINCPVSSFKGVARKC